MSEIWTCTKVVKSMKASLNFIKYLCWCFDLNSILIGDIILLRKQ